jgi:hypothetical protein
MQQSLEKLQTVIDAARQEFFSRGHLSAKDQVCARSVIRRRESRQSSKEVNAVHDNHDAAWAAHNDALPAASSVLSAGFLFSSCLSGFVCSHRGIASPHGCLVSSQAS